MAEKRFALTSPAVDSQGQIARDFTCDGDNRPPLLHWTHAPPETRSFALIMEDLDAPRGTFTHWIIWDIHGPTDARDPTDVSRSGMSGRNDFQSTGYGGPCPPPKHGAHRYVLRLHALDIDSLQLTAGSTRAELETAMEGRVLATAELVGRYVRA